jgi:hypothetical protein
MSEQLVINIRQGQKVDCSCKECHRVTKHQIVTGATIHGSENLSWGQRIDWAIEYQIIQCLGCETLSFRRASSNSQDSPIQIGPDEWEENVNEELFPSPHDGRGPVSDASLLPDKIQRIYEESLSALNSQHDLPSFQRTV